MCTTENPIENDNRPFQYTRTPTEINMILDQQGNRKNTIIIIIDTNKSTNSDTNTNRQNQDTNTFNVDTRTIITVNSPTPQQE